MNETAAPPLPPSDNRKPEWARNLPDTTAGGDPIVYGPRPLAPPVERVEPLDGYVLRVTFATGEVRMVECRPLLDRGVFRVLLNEVEFRRVAPINGGGGIGWESGADLSRDTLYSAGAPV